MMIYELQQLKYPSPKNPKLYVIEVVAYAFA